jgi:hypothetical protein
MNCNNVWGKKPWFKLENDILSIQVKMKRVWKRRLKMKKETFGLSGVYLYNPYEPI